MKQRLNPGWVKEMKEAIDAAKHYHNPIPFKPQVLSWNKAAQWLVARIAYEAMVPHVEQLGAGVKRISIKGTCCPFCGKVVK